MDSAFFYAFALLVLAGGLLTVTLRNPVHCAIGLMLSLVGTAGLFLLQRAEFLFAVQIILYVGGVVVLFLFVIMLVNLNTAFAEHRFQKTWPVAIACVAAVAAELAWIARSGFLQVTLAPGAAEGPAAGVGNSEALGTLLLTEYLLPFEIASVLLLAAIVGSVYMAKEPA